MCFDFWAIGKWRESNNLKEQRVEFEFELKLVKFCFLSVLSFHWFVFINIPMLHGKLFGVVSVVCGFDDVVVIVAVVVNGCCGDGDNDAATVESTEPGSLYPVFESSGLSKKFKLNSGPPSKLTCGIWSFVSSMIAPLVRVVLNDAVSMWKMSIVCFLSLNAVL